MDKPIVPGCKAVIVNSECGNNGMEVTVLEYMGLWTEDNNPYWTIDVEKVNRFGYFNNNCYEFQLKRIDYDEEASWEAIESITKWHPNREVA